MASTRKGTPNQLLNAARRGQLSPSGSGRTMSRQELAEAVSAYLLRAHGVRVNLDDTYIGKLERGVHRWPNDRYREAFRHVLRRDDDAELGFHVVRATIETSSWSLDDTELIELRRDRYERMYRQVGGVLVSPHIEAFLNSHLLPTLQMTLDTPAGRRLQRAAGTLMAVAGICAYDAEHHHAASKHFSHALRLAETAGDPALGGYVRALMANQALCLNDYRLAIRHTEVALQTGAGAISAALRTDLHAMWAKAHAHLGDQTECFRQFRCAQAASDAIKPDHEPAETSYVHPGLLELKQAESFMRMGDLRQAYTFAEESLRLGPTDPRGHFYGYATLAQILAADRRPDESLAWAQKALTVANGMESWRVTDRLKIVLNTLEPYTEDREVGEFLTHAQRALSTPLHLAYSAS